MRPTAAGLEIQARRGYTPPVSVLSMISAHDPGQRPLKRLPLHAAHQSLGAAFASSGDWELPQRFSGAVEEYKAAAETAALADVSFLGKLAFKGPDRHRFLQGLLTNDIQRLQPGRGLPTCLLTPKGKLVADFVLYDRGEDFLALHPPQATAAIQEALSKPLILSDTVIEDLSETLGAFCVAGPHGGRILEQVLGRCPELPAYGCSWTEQQGVRVLVASYPAFGITGWAILTPGAAAEPLWKALLDAGRIHGLKPMGFAALEMLRVEAGVALLGVDIDEQTLPLEVHLEKAISFDKGCYMGQETTARIKNFGHVNRLLVGLKVSGLAPYDAVSAIGADVLHEGVCVGKLTSAVESPRHGCVLGLGLVRSAQSRAGTMVRVRVGSKDYQAEVVTLPAA